jgi:hypothetical protein
MAIKPASDEHTPPPLDPAPKSTAPPKNAPAFDVRGNLYRIVGIDLTAVSGLEASTAQTILSEIGTDMSKWPTEKHFASWLGLAPHHDISGGKVLRSKPLKVHNRAAQALRMAAQAVGRTTTTLGHYDRRLRARQGPRAAIAATAHKLARVVYHLLKHREPYRPQSLAAYEEQLRHRELKQLKRKAAHLGFVLLPQQATDVA